LDAGAFIVLPSFALARAEQYSTDILHLYQTERQKLHETIWSDDATVRRQRLFFIGCPGKMVAIDNITDPLHYFPLFVSNDLLLYIFANLSHPQLVKNN